MEGIVDHWFIVNWEEVLVRYFCEGVEAGTCAACEDNAFHFLPPVKYFFMRMVFKYLSYVVGVYW